MNHVKIQTKEQKNVTRHVSHDESLLCKWKYTRYFCFIDNNLSQIKIIIFSQHFRPRLTCTPPQHQPWPWCTVLSAWSGSMGRLWETEGQDRRSEWIRTHRTAADEHWMMKSWQHGDWLLFSVCILSCVFWMLSRLCSLRDLSSWEQTQRLFRFVGQTWHSSKMFSFITVKELTWVCLISWWSSVRSSAILVSADMILPSRFRHSERLYQSSVHTDRTP